MMRRLQVLVVLGAFATPAASEVPERSPSGLTLTVPADQLGDGQAYHLLGGDTQITVRSRADLQGVTLTSGRAVGYLVGPFVEDAVEQGLEQPLLAGALRLPAHSLRSGAEDTDERIHGDALLGVAAHPEITLRFIGVSDVEAVHVPEEQASELVRATATANVSIGFKGEEHPLSIPVSVSYRLSNFQVMSRMVGDLATVASSFEVELSDLGIEIPQQMGLLVAPTVVVDVFLTFSTVDPDRVVVLIPSEQYVTESRIDVLLRDLRQTREGYALAREYLQAHWEDAVVLNRVALDLLTLDDVERRDFPLISGAAERADELTSGENPDVLTTLARIQFQLGHLEQAIELQKRAVEQLGEGNDAAARAQLEKYEAELAEP